MWLLNRTTYHVEYYHDPPPYLILSHTWGEEEVTFQDIKNLSKARTMKGFGKIKGICDVDLLPSVNHVWVDTCCIDKSSSAELTESINSMFRWYQEAACCIVYLEDLQITGESEAAPTLEQLRPCRWFRRGWTPQELIAPSMAYFFDREWNLKGTKKELADILCEITRVDMETLLDANNLPNVLIARRMSWAAERETTRMEDRAYCLLGIFDVHMPLIYGEREKAFARLQEAIVQRITHDLSIFAWSDRVDTGMGARNVFAQDPSDFISCGSLRPILDSTIPTPNILLTNSGVEIATSLVQGLEQYVHKLLLLDCELGLEPGNRIAIPLMETPAGYVRSQRQIRIISYGHLLFTPLARIRVVKDVSGSLYRGIIKKKPWTFNLSLEGSGGLGRPNPKALFFPEHLVSYAGDRECSLIAPGTGEHFTAVMEVRLPLGAKSGKTQVAAYAVCGSKEPMSSVMEDNQLWVTVFSDDDKSLKPPMNWDEPGVCMHNPYYISNLGQHFRSLHAENPEALVTEIKGKFIAISVTTKRKANRLEDMRVIIKKAS